MTLEMMLNINGLEHRVTVAPTETLVDVLRDRLHMTGTHKDCCMGICGSCTVLLDGHPVSSCLLLAVQAQGAQITTIEGLEQDSALHPLQAAFLKHAAVQCGYCTPGFLLTAKAFLDEYPRANREEIVAALEGNLCRCTGYVKIIETILSVAER